MQKTAMRSIRLSLHLMMRTLDIADIYDAKLEQFRCTRVLRLCVTCQGFLVHKPWCVNPQTTANPRASKQELLRRALAAAVGVWLWNSCVALPAGHLSNTLITAEMKLEDGTMGDMQAQLAQGSDSAGARSPRDQSPEALDINELMYPKADALHEEVVANGELFYSTLMKLLNFLQVPFKVPKIGGQEIDVHRLYCEVTRLGGLENVMARKLFVTVCEPFNFPSSFTNKSFVMRKLYCSILHHYEQVYYHRNEGPMLPIPVNEHQQAQRRVGSPAAKRTPSRTKSTPSKHSSGTPRCSGFKSAMNAIINSGSPMSSPSGKRKQSDPSAPSSLSKPSKGGAKGSSANLYAPYSMPNFATDGGMTMGFKPLLHATGVIKAVPSGYDGLGNHRTSLGACPMGDPCNMNLPSGVPLASPTTSCTSGTPQMSPPVCAPPGLEAGTHIPCRITAVYDHFYIISMEFPGMQPLLGQLMINLPPGCTVVPNVLPHQLIYEPRSAKKALRRSSQLYGGSMPGRMPTGLMGAGSMPPMHMADMSTAGGPMMPCAGMAPGRGKGFIPGLGPHDGLDEGLDGGVGDIDEFGDIDTNIPDVDLLTIDPMGHRDWDSALVDGPDMQGVGNVFDMGLGIGLADVIDADATAAVTAQFSPTTHQDTPKKMRLRANGDYAVVMNECVWPGLSPRAPGAGNGAAPPSSDGLALTSSPLGAGAGKKGGDGVDGTQAAGAKSAFTFYMAKVLQTPEMLAVQAGRPIREVAADAWEAMPATEKLPYQIMAKRDFERYSRQLQTTTDKAGDAIGAPTSAAEGNTSALSEGTEINTGLGSRSQPATSTDRVGGGTVPHHSGSGGGESDTKAPMPGQPDAGMNGIMNGGSDGSAAGVPSRQSTAQLVLPASGIANNNTLCAGNGGAGPTGSPFAPFAGSNTRAFDVRGAVGMGPAALVDVGGHGRVNMDPGVMFAHAEANSGLLLGAGGMQRLGMSHSMPPGGVGMAGVSPLQLQSPTGIEHPMLSGMANANMQGMCGMYGQSMGMKKGMMGGMLPMGVGMMGSHGLDMGPGVGMTAFDMSGAAQFHPGFMDDGGLVCQKARQYKQYKQLMREQHYGPAGILNSGHAAWAPGLVQRHAVPSCMPSMDLMRGNGLHADDLHGEEDATMLHMLPQHHAPMGELFTNTAMDISGGGAAPGRGGHGDGLSRAFHMSDLHHLPPLDTTPQEDADDAATADAFLLDLNEHMGLEEHGRNLEGAAGTKGATTAAGVQAWDAHASSTGHDTGVRSTGTEVDLSNAQQSQAVTRSNVVGTEMAVPPPAQEDNAGEKKVKAVMMAVPPSMPSKTLSEQFSGAMNVLVVGDHVVGRSSSPPRAS